LKNIFEKSREVFFITKQSRLRTEGKVTLVLSPEFYWIKKEELPVKRVYEAKRLAPSVFDGFLPEGNFSYIVYKEDEKFILIAYDKEEILKTLENIVDDMNNIEEIYFAQTEFSDIEGCVEIDDKNAIASIEGVIVQIPRRCANPSMRIDEFLEGMEFSKYKIKIGAQEVMGKKELVLYAAVFALFTLSFLTEYAIYKTEIKKMQTKKMQILTKYNLPRTSIQLKSIKNSLLKSYNTQKRIRDTIDYLGSVELKKGEFIDMISVDTKNADFSIKLSSKQRQNAVISYIQKRYKIIEKSQNNDILTIKIKV